jgi:hypothetical protein
MRALRGSRSHRSSQGLPAQDHIERLARYAEWDDGTRTAGRAPAAASRLGGPRVRGRLRVLLALWDWSSGRETIAPGSGAAPPCAMCAACVVHHRCAGELRHGDQCGRAHGIVLISPGCYYGDGHRVWLLRRLACTNAKLASLHLIAPVIIRAVVERQRSVNERCGAVLEECARCLRWPISRGSLAGSGGRRPARPAPRGCARRPCRRRP